MNKLAVGSLTILALFGIYFLSIAAHETVHVIQNKGAKSVCIDFNQKIADDHQQGFMTAHTIYNPADFSGIEEFYDFRSLTEKYASIVQYIFMIGAAFVLGALLMRK